MKFSEKFSDASRLLGVLWQYRKALKCKPATREALEQHQHAVLSKHLAWVAKKSPFYAGFLGRPHAEWPLIDKRTWMSAFDTMNTAGLVLEDALSVAMRAEQTRDFAPLLKGHTVGLSSGTSGARGVFVASPAERAQWAGAALAKLLPGRLFAGERIAFFLRANSTLYTSVASPWLTFQFFDLLTDFELHLPALEAYRPTILIAPAQVLAQLAIAHQAGRLRLPPVRIISVAEVLEPTDRILLEQTLGVPEQVYQATEGFLAYTCAQGRLHLNETMYHIEPHWIDEARTRMMPIITDLYRKTHPLIRYRLNDVLVVGNDRCECKNPSRVIDHIEGRNDDMLLLPGVQGIRPVFADAVSRLLLQILPLDLDYRLVQSGPCTLVLTAGMNEDSGRQAADALRMRLDALGVQAQAVDVQFVSAPVVFDPSVKRRRIVRRTA